MSTKSVRRPYERIQRTVKNNGGRRPLSDIKGIALHTTEGHDRPGISDLAGLGDFFNGSVQSSSHVAVDGEGHSARYVPDGRKAWTQAAYNGSMLSVEQIGFAAWPRKFWRRYRNPQLRKTAQYIAYWSKKYDIPIRRGKVAGGSVTKSGVFRHSDFGALGGNHGDPGRGYPMHYVLHLARKYKKRGW
jgi:hypothetical protein